MEASNFDTAEQSPNRSTPCSSMSFISSLSAEASTSSVSEPTTVKKLKILPIDDAFNSVSSFSRKGSKSKQITESLLFMIAKDALPYSLVENEGFKHFIKCAVPLYKVPSRRTITKMIDSKYDQLREIVKSNFKSATNLVLTTDIWTETGNTVSYLGLTVHYLKPKTELKTVLVGVFPLSNSHTASYIKDNMISVCDQWAIDLEKVVCVVTDNGANMVRAVNDTFGPNKHIPCFAHTLNLVAIKSIELSDVAIKNLILKVKSIVTFTKQTVSASDEIRRLQLNEGKTEGSILKLIQEVPTRWNSTYHMLERFILLSDIVSVMLLKFPKSPPMLTATELEMAKEIKKILQPIEFITVELCGSDYVTCSSVIPLEKCMSHAIESCTTLNSDAVLDLKSNILKQIDKRFKSVELVNILAVSTLLDPRYKKLHFKNPLALSSAIQFISNILKKSCIMTDSEKQQSVSEPVEQTHNDDDLWSYHEFLMTKESTKTQMDTSSNELHVELRHYLQQPLINRKDDPIKYWVEMENIFPMLSKLALKYFIVTATSVPSERLFSKAGNIMTEKRNRLSSKRLAALLFLGSLNKDDWPETITISDFE